MSGNGPHPTGKRTTRAGTHADPEVTVTAESPPTVVMSDTPVEPDAATEQIVRLDDLMEGSSTDIEERRPVVIETVAAPVPAVVPATSIRPVGPDAQWGWRGRLVRMSRGLITPAPSEEERRYRDEVREIATRTWPRPVNIAVLNLKGGSGKTPTALTLAGMLADIRGGGVAVFEACDTAGTLSGRAEGASDRGLTELLGAGEDVASAVQLSGFMQRQSSHTDVLASSDLRRPVLTHDDVMAIRRQVDRFYSMSVTDTGINPTSGAWRAAVRTADAVVLPVTYTSDALAGAMAVLDILRAAEPAFSDPERGLVARAVVVLSDQGGRPSKEVVARVTAQLRALGVPVLTVPFDPALQDGEILPAALTPASRRAWTSVTAKVVEMCTRGDLTADLVTVAPPPER